MHERHKNAFDAGLHGVFYSSTTCQSFVVALLHGTMHRSSLLCSHIAGGQAGGTRT